MPQQGPLSAARLAALKIQTHSKNIVNAMSELDKMKTSMNLGAFDLNQLGDPADTQLGQWSPSDFSSALDQAGTLLSQLDAFRKITNN